MKTWYIRNNDEHLGPYSIEELKLLGLYSDDYVWKEGLGKWTKASTLEELQQFLITVEEHLFHGVASNASVANIEECPSIDKLNKMNDRLNRIFNKKIFAGLFRNGKSKGRFVL